MTIFTSLLFTQVLVLAACLFNNFLDRKVNAFPASAAVFRRQPIGRITSLDRSKLEPVQDENFYSQPNLVTHTDDAFIQSLQKLYTERLSDNDMILDIMSSHVSHLPSNISFRRVDLHGMNPKELQANPARKATEGIAHIRDLNENPSLIGLYDDSSIYDAVLCCVGVQYLQEPETVFAEVARVLKPGGTVIVSFTNRFFYQKAIRGWFERGMKERTRLVQDYFRAAGGFEEEIEIVGDGRSVWAQLKSIGGVAGDPFVAVVARRVQIKGEE